MHRQRIGFGGGCHWCTEAVFQNVRGVSGVAQGFIRSDAPHGRWSEAVEATFDPHEIDLSTLIEIHLRTHSSTAAHRMRGKYRSAVYVFGGAQHRQVTEVLDVLRPGFDAPLQTLILRHRGFMPSDERFRNYYATDPERPFCRSYIDPKLRLLRDRFAMA